ncbi:MAG: hypothetical protein V7735_16715 [Photobacterium frigidiphilum]|jgi:hypothetical protein|uniref:Uncharacterized protein n=1 Tax=Photobacterium frigidiphilum TaxID=264736 RepID=A0A2T3J8J5_9GAMM|nr:hypothetical protein [Photobacterium frigidiphilum]PSU45095.1 hypothetical protein C9J12_24335 [Photobacterium frigidiphilum]
MSNIIAFPVKEQPKELSPLEVVVEQELLDIGADPMMARVIVERMEKFLVLASFEFDMTMSVSKECVDEMRESVFPAITKMETNIKDAMSELMTERVLHEIQLYRLEQQA